MQYCNQSPQAVACVHGSPQAPALLGKVEFYQKPEGVLVVANIRGLPKNDTGFYGFHIHQGTACTGKDFADTQGHFNPKDAPHPNHAGDLPPLMGCGTKAHLAVLTNRFSVADMIGRTVVIHSNPDDFHTQPAGNAGTKIACGVIGKA